MHFGKLNKLTVFYFLFEKYFYRSVNSKSYFLTKHHSLQDYIKWGSIH